MFTHHTLLDQAIILIHPKQQPKLKREHENEGKEVGEAKPRPSKSARRAHAPPGVATAPNIGAAAISMVSDMLSLVKVCFFNI